MKNKKCDNSKNYCYVCGYDAEDLVRQFTKMQNEKDNLISKYRYWKGECVALKQQLAEKEKEIEELKDYIGCKGCIDLIAKTHQDKISFCIEKLEKVKEFLFEQNIEITRLNKISDFIDNQIKLLKEGK